MADQNTTIILTFDQSPEEVFRAVVDVHAWWSKTIEGDSTVKRAEFVFDVPNVHQCRIRVEEFVPNERLVWRVLDSKTSFVQDQQEWNNTEIRFEISRRDDGLTQLHFTHIGLVPDFECYDVCHKSWNFHVGYSLRNLITVGTGQPNDTDDADALGARIDAAVG